MVMPRDPEKVSSRPPRDEKLRHLVRLDAPGTHGWQLRVPAWHPEGPFTRYFSDLRYGSPHKAFLAAREERDAVFQAAALPVKPKGRRPCGPVGARNRSGLSGVFIQQNRQVWYWVAIWSEQGRPHRQRFSVSGLGYEGAFWQAVELRQHKTGVLFTNEELRQALRRGRELQRGQHACGA